MKMRTSKLFLIPVLFLYVSTLASCEPAEYYFNYDELKDSVETIKLINYENPNPKRINEVEKILPYDFAKAEDVESLESNKYKDFFQELSGVEFLMMNGFCEAPVHICIVMIHKNNDFVVISSTLIGESVYGGAITYDSEGNVKEYLGRFASRLRYVNLVNNYFVTQVE